MKEIKTLDELKQYVGKILVFSYNNGDGTPSYVWMKKITAVEPESWYFKNEKGLRFITVYGIDTVVLGGTQAYRNPHKSPPFVDKLKEECSNAQAYAREPTLGEMLIYRRLIIKEKYKLKKQREFEKEEIYQSS